MTAETPLDPSQVANPTVSVTNVSKWFGQKVAVSNLTCSFGPGLTGLLGPNGAGKTTLLRMMSGLSRPSEGSISVNGRSPRQKPEVYRDLALVPEEDAVYGHMTARELIAYSARLSNSLDIDRRVQSAIDEVELSDAADRHISGFSKGMRQRAKVAAALVNDPQVLVLDEPLNGTDPVQRSRLISIFRQLGSEGRTVIVSSHVLQEVERMTDRVIAIVDGKLAAAGDVGAIRSAMADIPYRVLIASDKARPLAVALLESEAVIGVAIDGDRMHVETTDLRQLGREVPRVAAGLRCRIGTFRPEDDSLESVFRYLVRGR